MTADENGMDQAIREAADERAIRHVLTRYTRAIDRFDMDLLRTVYHPDAYDDHGGYKGDVEGFIVYLQEVLPRFEGTQHFLGNMHIELDGDVAHTETYCQAWHHIAGEDGAPDHDSVAGLRYVDRFERRDGRVAHRRTADRARLDAQTTRWRAGAGAEDSRREPSTAAAIAATPRTHFGR